jgi:mRNA-degrading endonuclease HigB of HigAB toxin-antitoxin module
MSGETTTSNPESKLIKKGKFYFILEDSQFLLLVDKTKRGLEVKDTITDENSKVISERGMIYDMEGTGHKVVKRWFYPKSKYDIEFVTTIAERMEKKYQEIREMTCPDDL